MTLIKSIFRIIHTSNIAPRSNHPDPILQKSSQSLPRSLQWISSWASRYFSAASSDSCCSSAARSADSGSTGRQPPGSARLVAWTWPRPGGRGNMARSSQKPGRETRKTWGQWGKMMEITWNWGEMRMKGWKKGGKDNELQAWKYCSMVLDLFGVVLYCDIYVWFF